MPELRAKRKVEVWLEIALEVVVERQCDWERRHIFVIRVSRAREAARIVRSNVLPATRLGTSVSFKIRGLVVFASRAVSAPSC